MLRPAAERCGADAVISDQRSAFNSRRGPARGRFPTGQVRRRHRMTGHRGRLWPTAEC